ncbi:PREDICTED: uncharacterized protein LOC108754341 [Trachymyrmex septentrionalis]|uniref:uncharacterized protein LOC108754341 n=1 Tax=Trachymyrmex septentrionalis TaxID=34720 RepID=UPI00084F36EE|nr:PREDICTED: uncharacterized protein LOC108754341 [Trachymyrmex septentrionalis]
MNRGLEISPNKTQMMVFLKRKKIAHTNLSVNLVEIIPSSDSVRFLGVVLDPKLSGKKHMEYVICKDRRNSITSALRGTW